jgi:hypothetical protein
MNNQSSGSGGGSPKVQAMKGPASKTVGGQGPAVDASMGTATVAGSAASAADLSSGAADSPIVPDGVKIGHA